MRASYRIRRPDAGEQREDLAPAPAPHALLQLQRTLGNQGVVSVLARNKGKKKPTPPKPIDIDVDDTAGTIKSTAGELIGFKAGDSWYATPGAAAPSAAKLGELETSAGKLGILKVRKSKVTVGADGSETMTQEGGDLGAVLGTTPALVMAGKNPVELAKLPAGLKSTIPANARIILDDGKVWLAVTFPDGSGLNWVYSKHSKREFAGRKKLMEDAIATLPEGLKTKITPELDFMAMISTLEGTFSSRSESFWTPLCKHSSHGAKGWTGKRVKNDKAAAEKEAEEHEKANKDHDADVVFSGDAAASLGIHQWAMPKHTAGAGGSLVEFFKTLQSRAKAAEAKKPEDRSEEEAIYVEAWGQCTTAGLSIVGGKLQIGGKDATGLEVEDALAAPMATGGLRKYQVIMIAEELAELWAMPVVPGMWGSHLIGNKYTASSPRKDAAFPTDKYTIKLAAPATVATIGEVCTDDRMKMAVANIFPNRPGWMGALVWRSLIAGDPQALAAEEIAKIVKAEDAKPKPEAEPEPEAKPEAKAKKKPAKAKAPAKPEITEDTAGDKQAFKDLQALVWPSGDKADQDKLLAAFNATVLQYYKGEDEKTLPGSDWKSHPEKTPKTGRKLRYGWKSRAQRLASAEAGG
ncbi:MAG TPA: hypothetical protein VFZ00_32105 [Solirubrobacter sp.]|nr:hypothetical protein [Solirubrobacter sp.]